MLMGQYNSTLGKVIGFTKAAKDLADILNHNTAFLRHEIWKTELCKRNAPLAYKPHGLLTPVEPTVLVRSVEAVDSRHPVMLVCSAYSFYPKHITVTWLRNREKVTSDVMSTEELSSGNWLYQVHSYLEFTPRPGEKIACMVEHASLSKPKLYDWEPVSDPGMSKITVGAAGLVLGLVFSISGLIYYKIKSSVRVLVPTTEVLYPEQTL
ncbi:DLA class II histocompatibility antigen, DR-1 beta chain-like isoform 2-T2 [Symphorus nematophorus]